VNRLALPLFGLSLILFACGAGCPNMLRQEPVFQTPVAFETQPSMEQLIAHVNANSSKIQSLESTGASIGLKGYPSIRAQIYMAPPMKFRLIGETSLTGQLLDLGSNDQEFWVWGKGFETPGLMYARHDEFQNTTARQMLPVEPSWVAQAMGLARFDPQDFHQGPYITASGHYEIRSTMQSPAGAITKSTVIDKAYGYVLEQHVYDATGQPIASALCSNHQFDPTYGVSMPHRVDIRLPKTGVDFSIQVIGYRINQLSEFAGIFARPSRPDVPAINIATGVGMPQLPANNVSPTGQGPSVMGQPYPATNTAPSTSAPMYPLGASQGLQNQVAPVTRVVRPRYQTAELHEFDNRTIRGLQ